MITNEIEITLAERSDLSGILEIQKKAFQYEAEIYHRDDLPPMTQSLESISRDFNEFIYLKATHDKKVIGSVRLKIQNSECFVGRLIVNPAYQKQGIGTLLMDYVEKKYSEIKRFELFTGEKSERNIQFYKKRGYSVFGEFNELGNIKLVKMEKLTKERV